MEKIIGFIELIGIEWVFPILDVIAIIVIIYLLYDMFTEILRSPYIEKSNNDDNDDDDFNF